MVIRQNDSGRSIVEMLGVLAIMGVITVMGIQGYSQAIGKINRNKVSESVTRIAQEVRSLYASRDSYKNDSSNDGENIGKILEDMKIDLKSPYGYKIGVYNAGDGRGFSISINNIPLEDCAAFQIMGFKGAMNPTITEIKDIAYFGTGSAQEGGKGVTDTSCPTSGVAKMSVYFK